MRHLGSIKRCISVGVELQLFLGVLRGCIVFVQGLRLRKVSTGFGAQSNDSLCLEACNTNSVPLHLVAKEDS